MVSLIPSNPTAAGAGAGGGGGRAGLRNGGYGRDGLYGGEGMGGGMAQVQTPPSEEAVETLMVRLYLSTLSIYLCITNRFIHVHSTVIPCLVLSCHLLFVPASPSFLVP